MNARAVVLALCVALATWAAQRAVAGGFAGLGDDAAGFADVTPGTPITFPADHGPHPAYRIEWWYVTANLQDANGASYGVQWTLFRQAMEPGDTTGWSSPQVWMGHAAATSADKHYFAEKLARGGIGQAGAEAAPFRAWIDDWTFATSNAATGVTSATLTAGGNDFSYTLQLASERPMVLHGDAGYSRKSPQGQASYYFSQPFFDVTGTLTLDGKPIAVTGRAWMDREWSSQPLAAHQKGWDWFSLHLAGGEKLMLFQLREEAQPGFRSGSWIAADGKVTPLASDDIELTPRDYANMAGKTLPVAWNVKVKSRNLDIATRPLNRQSWMKTLFAYWEGPITFSGTQAGEGYLEMTGY